MAKSNSNSLVEESSYVWNGKPKIFKKEIDETNPYTVVDLFCGAGGASYGFQSAGFNVVLGIDHLIPALNTFKKNHENSSTILGDIKDISPELIEDILDGINVKVLIGGVPCQGFSLNNRKRREDDPRNQLFYEFVRFIKILKPDMIMLENVSGMKSMKNGEVVETIRSEIISAGEEIGKKYNVEYKMLNAADYGVPQLRNRLIFLGGSSNFNITFPKQKFSPDNYRTVRDAIGDMPSLKPKENKKEYAKEPFSEYQKLMRKGSKFLFNNQAPNHPQKTVDRIKNTLPGEPMYPRYKQRIRLSWDAPSPTQVCGGIRPQFQFGHPEDNRGLTIRERARIQSFPDTFMFTGGMVQERVQTGNAVPPLLAQAIAENLYGELSK
ncbi:DNA cytosine methyltransferase [Methanobrevibacter sp.]|uniref:DNA cytosine methyltransferase n=1 Tax=Methanobrevibacter sp. TaxID=66852 RepID=UPI00386473C3